MVEGLVTYDFTLHLRVREHTTWFWRCVGTAFGHFLLGLLEVVLTQKWETTALRTLSTIDIILSNHVWEPAWIEIHGNSIWVRARLHTIHLRIHYHITWFWRCVGRDGGLWTLFFWALTISWSRLLARVWSGPKKETESIMNRNRNFLT